MRPILAYNAIALLLVQTPNPALLAKDYFSGAGQLEIFLATVEEKGANGGGFAGLHDQRIVLVLHARETENEIDADIQIWPSGRVKLKHEADLDKASLDFWRGITLLDGVKKEVCR